MLSALALMLAALLPAQVIRLRQAAREFTCADNLRAVGQSLHIYANQYREWFPHHYFAGRNTGPMDEVSPYPMHWVGMMGSTEALLISEPTSRDNSPYASHPSRSLFLLLVESVVGGGLSAETFVCPNAGERPDDLWNYGPDGDVQGVPGLNRFDFRGYDHLSYGYQMPFGRRGRPRETLAPTMPILADKGPYYQGYWLSQSSARSVHDERSDIDPPRDWAELRVEEILALTTEWQPYNSRNHGGQGQNVLTVDGSVTFAETPIVGEEYDNIYTLWGSRSDQRDSMIGVMPDADQPWGPAMQSDSFLVP
jgi:hypothetical protein